VYSASNGINELLSQATNLLKRKKITSAVLDAEVLLSYVLKKSREYLFAHPEKMANKNQVYWLKSLLKRRSRLEPIAYLTHQKEFYNLEFYVDQRVLIPRPETEILVEEILKMIPKNSKATIADIGTGSGCIAITLAKHLPKAKIIASDISKNAIAVAKRNASRYSVAKRVKFVVGNLLKPIAHPIDIIVANLPYLSQKDENKEIKFEPYQALFGRKNGLEHFENLLKQASVELNPQGKIFLEIQPAQLKSIKVIALNNFPKAEIRVIKDLSGQNRIMEISSKKNSVT